MLQMILPRMSLLACQPGAGRGPEAMAPGCAGCAAVQSTRRCRVKAMDDIHALRVSYRGVWGVDSAAGESEQANLIAWLLAVV